MLFRNEAGFDEIGHCNFCQTFGIGQRLKNVQVNGFVLYTVEIFETGFRYAALQRHLTTFEANLLLVTGTGLGSFVTTG